MWGLHREFEVGPDFLWVLGLARDFEIPRYADEEMGYCYELVFKIQIENY